MVCAQDCKLIRGANLQLFQVHAKPPRELQERTPVGEREFESRADRLFSCMLQFTMGLKVAPENVRKLSVSIIL